MQDNRMPGVVHYNGYTRELALKSVGEGWASLVNEVFDKLETIKGQTKVIQVKEKWGGLRIYTDYINEDLDNVIRSVEKRSYEICEVSGAPGKLRNCNGWYRTLSDEHAANYPVVISP
jgi:hypothetical protein